jgi:hypothetical protein
MYHPFLDLWLSWRVIIIGDRPSGLNLVSSGEWAVYRFLKELSNP